MMLLNTGTKQVPVSVKSYNGAEYEIYGSDTSVLEGERNNVWPYPYPINGTGRRKVIFPKEFLLE